MTKDLWSALRQPEAEQARLWELFHENSKVTRWDERMPNDEVLKRMQEMYESLPYDSYPAVPLPPPSVPLAMSVQDAIRKRRTARGLRPRPMSLEKLSTLLALAYGVTADNAGGAFVRSFRAAPSGGALYPLDIFFHSVRIDGLPPGLYHYNPIRHDLRLVREGDLSREISDALVQQETPFDSTLVLFLTAFFERSTFKYGNRGYRFVLIEAGHVAQNVNLVSVALGFGVRNIGGFLDRKVDDMLQLDGCTQSAVYLMALGELADDGVSGHPDIR